MSLDGKTKILLIALFTVSACSTIQPVPEQVINKELVGDPELHPNNGPDFERKAPLPEERTLLGVHECVNDESCEHGSVETPSGGAQSESIGDVLPRVDFKGLVPKIYGTPQPLVCNKSIPPFGAVENRPNLQVMWENYIDDIPQNVWAVVGGAVEINGCLPEDRGQWRNACTVRLSHMLNKAGHKIPKIIGKTVSGRSGAQYFFRLTDVQEYLESVFGKADMDINEGAGRWLDLPSHPGLIILKFPGSDYTGHASLWDGTGTVDNTDIAANRILFWKLPCFIPPSRNTRRQVPPEISLAATTR